MNQRTSRTFLKLVCLLAVTSPAWTAPLTLYGVSARFPATGTFYAMDSATGAVLDEFTTEAGYGLGVTVVGNTLYYTLVNSGSVFSYTLSTHTDTGALFPVAGSRGLWTIAYDGTNFWIGGGNGTDKAYYYSPTGTLLRTITLENCTGFCIGLEYYQVDGQGRLISNRTAGSGRYDIYDTSGNLLTSAFINTTTLTNGIAFDGVNFYIHDFFSGRIGIYNGTTGEFIRDEPITGFNRPPFLEDLSFDYRQTLSSPTATPESSTLFTLGGGSLATVLIAKRRTQA